MLNFFGNIYKYRVGDVVHLGGNSQFLTIGWRGYLLVGPPGRRIRVPVYWLESDWRREINWHWDCYYEDELYAIGSLPF